MRSTGEPTAPAPSASRWNSPMIPTPSMCTVSSGGTMTSTAAMIAVAWMVHSPASKLAARRSSFTSPQNATAVYRSGTTQFPDRVL